MTRTLVMKNGRIGYDTRAVGENVSLVLTNRKSCPLSDRTAPVSRRY